MQINFGTVIRGMLLSCTVLILMSAFVTANAKIANPPGMARVQVEGSPPQEESRGSSPDEQELAGCRVSRNYPVKVRRWCQLIEKYAGKYDLQPDLVAAVIWQESGGNPDAYSKSGAVGLMQVMPRDGIAASFNCINGPCFAGRPTIAQLKDPDFNIEFGTRMLAGLARRHASMRDALKAYGPANSSYSYADKVLAIFRNSRDG